MWEVKHKRKCVLILKIHLKCRSITGDHGGSFPVFVRNKLALDHLQRSIKRSNQLRCSLSHPFTTGLKTLMEQPMGMWTTPPFKAILTKQKFPCLHVEWQYLWRQDNPFRWQIAELFTHKLHISLHFNSSRGRTNLVLTLSTQMVRACAVMIHVTSEY